MFEKKLHALNYADPGAFNIDDDKEFRIMVLWLEDQKIRHYKIEDRAGLRGTENIELWMKELSHYLTELKSPYSLETYGKSEVLDWLLGYAVRLEYGDNLKRYNITCPNTDSAPATPASNPLDNIDFNSPDVKAGVVSLAQLFHIPPYPDHLEVLKAICRVVRDKLSPESIEKAKLDVGKKDYIGLENIKLGFDSGDYVSNDAAKILRLLHIQNLRDLQTQINAAIVAVQAITADPKTDTKLGKVGR